MKPNTIFQAMRAAKAYNTLQATDEMRVNKCLQATVVYVFFLGLSTASLMINAARYFAGDDFGMLTVFSLVCVLATGALSSSCYRDLRALLKQVTAPEPFKSQPGSVNKAS